MDVSAEASGESPEEVARSEEQRREEPERDDGPSLPPEIVDDEHRRRRHGEAQRDGSGPDARVGAARPAGQHAEGERILGREVEVDAWRVHGSSVSAVLGKAAHS